MVMRAELPLYVKFDDGEEWILNTVEEIECNLEWFDTDDGDKSAEVFDNQGRSVRLKVEGLQLFVCELMESNERERVKLAEITADFSEQL